MNSPATFRAPADRIVLFYQGSCSKCRFLAKLVTGMSLSVIKKVPIERKESLKFFFEDHPKARGYPILFINARPFYSGYVFLAVPLAIVMSWVNGVIKITRYSTKHYNKTS